MAASIVHCVMGGGIVLASYWRSDYAMMHARCVTGCDAVAVDLTSVPDPLRAIILAEVLNELPEDIRDDIETDFLGSDDDETPPVVNEHELSIDELDDH